MAAPATLTDVMNANLEKAIEANPELAANEPTQPVDAPPQRGQAEEGNKPSDENKPAESKPAEGSKNLSDLGIEGAASEDDEEDAKPAESAKLELAIEPTQVVGKLNGKDVTGAELVNAVAAHADVTKTRTEFADYRKNAEPAIEYIRANMEPLRALEEAATMVEIGDTTGAQAKLVAAFEIVAKQIGIEFKQPAGGRERDSQGRFTSSSASEWESELEALAEEFGKDSREYKTAKRQQELDERLRKSEEFQQSAAAQQKAAQEAAQARSQVETLAQKWTEKGVKGVNVEAAAALVGKPMTPAQALQLANFKAAVEWYVEDSGSPGTPKRPNEPDGGGAGAPASPEGLGFMKFLDKKIEGFGQRRNS